MVFLPTTPGCLRPRSQAVDARQRVCRDFRFYSKLCLVFWLFYFCFSDFRCTACEREGERERERHGHFECSPCLICAWVHSQ